MKKILILSILGLGAYSVFMGIHKTKSLQLAGTPTPLIKKSEVFGREPSTARFNKKLKADDLQLQITQLEAEIERYSRFLDDLESAKHNPEQERELELFLDQGSDSALSGHERNMIMAKIEKWEEHEYLLDKFMKEASPDKKTPSDFYEQLIKEKKIRLEQLK